MGKIVVVGGGAVGLASAYYLARRGATVTVVDQGDPGAGCSWGNQGWIVPSLSGPVAAPGVVGTSIKWMLKPDSPLYIKPAAVPKLAGWLWQFWRHCNEQDYLAGLQAVATMNDRTMSLFDDLAADGVQFEMYQKGLLFAFMEEANLEHTLVELEPMRSHGYNPKLLAPDEVRDLEPALSPAIVGGIFLEQERHVRPDSFTAGLARKLAECGVEIRAGVTVTGFTRKGRTVAAVETTAGALAADQVLLTTGAWASFLARDLGFRLPVQAAKGYSITFSQPSVQIQRALYLGDAKVGVSPFQGALRLGGTMELSGINANLDRHRIAALRRAARRYLVPEVNGAAVREWAGMRPLAPDGLPVIGRVPTCENAFVATGHGMLGITMAPVTGSVMAGLMCDGKSDVDLAALDPVRFVR